MPAASRVLTAASTKLQMDRTGYIHTGAGWRGIPYLSRCAVRCARGRVLAGAVRGVFATRLARWAVGIVGCARHFVARGVVSSLARLSHTTQRRLLGAG